MRDLAEFDAFSDRLAVGFAGVPGAHGLVFLGSAAAGHRRDRWSDHDFLALVEEEHAESARANLEWLPDPQRVLCVAREGELGFSVLYDDGHVLEFAVGTTQELAAAPLDEAKLMFGDTRMRDFVDAGQDRLAALPAIDPANEVALAYIKLLIGYGRACRGERIAAGRFVRGWAVDHLLRAIRARILPAGAARSDPLDPSRRFDAAYPHIATQLDHALAQPIEQSARDVAMLARVVLEHGWKEFPTTTAERVQSLLRKSGDAPS